MKAFVIAFAALAFLAAPAAAQDEGAATLEGLLVTHGEAPLPNVGPGAANYSPEQTASFLCERQDVPLSFVLNSPVRRAHEATLKAREVRIRAARGEATEREMREAELERQAAVRLIGGVQRAGDFPGSTWRGLVIALDGRERVIENGRAVLKITGTIHNTTASTVELPPLTVQAIDVRGFSLAGQTSQLDAVEIGPNETQSFTFRFRNPPQYTASLRVHFAPPFGVRNFRGCDFLDPLVFDAREAEIRAARAAVTPVAAPRIGPGAPDYTPQELAAMARQARADAQSSFNNRNRTSCAPVPPWRPLMVLADGIEEAWIATTAAEEVRRDAARGIFLPEEVAEAELARQAAVRDFMARRPPPRHIAPAEHADLAIENLVQMKDRDFVLRGQVRNRGKSRAEIPPLLLTLIDRHGFVVTESLHRPQGRIRAGGTQTFTLTVRAPADLIAQVDLSFAC